jgi:hypothetical protein
MSPPAVVHAVAASKSVGILDGFSERDWLCLREQARAKGNKLQAHLHGQRCGTVELVVSNTLCSGVFHEVSCRALHTAHRGANGSAASMLGETENALDLLDMLVRGRVCQCFKVSMIPGMRCVICGIPFNLWDHPSTLALNIDGPNGSDVEALRIARAIVERRRKVL